MSSQVFFMLSCGDSYNGTHQRYISNTLAECEKMMKEWLDCKCTQSYCIISKHCGFQEEIISRTNGKCKPENPWD